jgi:hypothetical protein
MEEPDQGHRRLLRTHGERPRKAMRTIELALGGERDPLLLRDRVLESFSN